MTRLSDDAIRDVALMAGFKGDSLVTAIAVAIEESGGNPDAVNINKDKYRSRDRGLWQINDHWHPEVTDAVAFDPTQAAAAAYAISRQGTNWTAWSAVKSGAYLMYVPRAKKSVAKLVDTGSLPPSGPGTYDDGSPLPDQAPGYKNPDLVEPDVPTIGSGLLSWADGLSKVLAWLTDAANWQRIGLVAAGVVCLVLGVIITKEDDLKSAAGAAAKLAVVA